MPYIKPEERTSIDEALKPLFEQTDDVGKLNYTITRLIGNYLLKKGLKYETLNAIKGVLGCVESEFYTRVVTPYEGLKQSENTDVSEYEIISEEIVERGKSEPVLCAYTNEFCGHPNKIFVDEGHYHSDQIYIVKSKRD